MKFAGLGPFKARDGVRVKALRLGVQIAAWCSNKAPEGSLRLLWLRSGHADRL